MWAGGCVKGKLLVAGTDEVSEKSIIVNVPGHLTAALNPQMICANMLQHLLLMENECIQLNSKHLLWVFDNGGLGFIHDMLWERISTAGIAPSSLTLVKPLTGFLYTLAGDAGFCWGCWVDLRSWF